MSPAPLPILCLACTATEAKIDVGPHGHGLLRRDGILEQALVATDKELVAFGPDGTAPDKSGMRQQLAQRVTSGNDASVNKTSFDKPAKEYGGGLAFKVVAAVIGVTVIAVVICMCWSVAEPPLGREQNEAASTDKAKKAVDLKSRVRDSLEAAAAAAAEEARLKAEEAEQHITSMGCGTSSGNSRALEQSSSAASSSAGKSSSGVVSNSPCVVDPAVVEAAEKADNAGLLPFFRGTGSDCEGRLLADIRQWEFNRMEMVHNYIQWLFPTDEMSMFNHNAPVLTPPLQKAFGQDAQLKQELWINLALFCSFLGLELRGNMGGPCEVVVSDNFEERIEDCWASSFGGNHNWLRISRVLQCLGLCQMYAEQKAFHTCVATLPAVKGVRCESALPHWKQRADTRPAA